MASTSSPSTATAVVIGSSRGLGRGVALALAARGARVFAIARDAGALAALARGAPGIEPLPGDAADDALAKRVLAEHRPDLVVLCAGAIPVMGAFHEQTWADWQTNWNVDAKAAFVWLGHALRLPMKPGSHLIVVSSGAAINGSPASGGYASAKRAQWYMTEYAATEIARAGLGLRVHCLLPQLNGSTALGRAGIATYAQRAGIPVEEFQKRFEPALTPEIMGRGVVDLFESPERFDKVAYRITASGLAAV